MATNAQINANRANAQLSTGPTSEAGKARSSKNAVTTGLTGRTVLLPAEDAALYESHCLEFLERHQPADEAEKALVQSLADTEWRLQRIPSLEAGIYAIGRLELADLFPNEEESVRKQLIEAKIFLTYQRQLNNLSVQENRLRRQREKDLAALKELQEARKQQLQAQLDQAARQYIKAFRENRHEQFDPAQFGFVFSTDQIKRHALNLDLNFSCEYRAQRRKTA
ncbi:MAG TPA: hypothetical protein VFB14_15380 [Bryobacteraceae bacterium]|jgi:hypothetical protein|nr:hypothetical protein [Bryobacteraceae bacterium]